MLHNLVAGRLGTSTDDVGLTRGLLDCDSILADVLEPDVVEIARTKTMYAFGLVGANHDVPCESR